MSVFKRTTPGDRDRRGSSLLREIVVILTVKFALLFAIWTAWFSGPARPGVDAAAVSHRLFVSEPASSR